MLKLAYQQGCLEALIKLGAISLSPAQLALLRKGKFFREVLSKKQLKQVVNEGGGYLKGIDEAVHGSIKGAPPRPPSPVLKKHLDRITGRTLGDAPRTLDPVTRKTQRELKRVLAKNPELIAANEDYVRPGQKGLSTEGLRKSKTQRDTINQWLENRKMQTSAAPGLLRPAPGAPAAPSMQAQGTKTVAGRPSALGSADTQYNIVARKPRPANAFADTMYARYAPV